MSGLSRRVLCQGQSLLSGALARQFTAAAAGSSFKLPDLPYDYNALEPVISAEIMQLHHKKHHQAYVTNLNASLDKYHDSHAKGDVASMIQVQQNIRFNGGGHVNHSIFWTNLAPTNKGGGQLDDNDIKKALVKEFGSVDNFINKMNTATGAVQGSGWGWLGYNKENGRLQIATCANQDPLSTLGLVPLLGLDVWEHAYYLQYKNARPDYLKAIWKVVNWNNVNQRFLDAQK